MTRFKHLKDMLRPLHLRTIYTYFCFISIHAVFSVKRLNKFLKYEDIDPDNVASNLSGKILFQSINNVYIAFLSLETTSLKAGSRKSELAVMAL